MYIFSQLIDIPDPAWRFLSREQTSTWTFCTSPDKDFGY